ncbi:Yersinia protein of uncharacterised function (DUF3831) [Yersinia enterocolitica]|uniref:Yersinia protein of uncharacterized function (DUF3831) n=1 Tax=Yersinia enterocolitica TaxID=630 RepID=A0ABM9SIM6_YEREN|nr:Yersinia protein of uncharacterised function (DUF3831) [Yersinia enterocolitica]CQD73436.1 Yersinia protein of uncharacterised function (DUF3831) [Yersinia enterocolitica]
MARLEPSGTFIFTKGIRCLYDLPVFTVAGTLSITSNRPQAAYSTLEGQQTALGSLRPIYVSVVG